MDAQFPVHGAPQAALTGHEQALEQLLRERCACHDRAPAAVGTSRRPIGSRLPVRMVRPLIRHVRAQARTDCLDFGYWSRLQDDDYVAVTLADHWIESASQRLNDPALGLHALGELRRGGNDVVELAAESAPTLGHGLNALIRYAHLLCEAAELHLHTGHGLAALELRYAIALSPMTRDFITGGLVRALSAWLGPSCPLTLWLSDKRPAQVAQYQAAFAPLRVHFGSSRDAVVFPEALLARPLRGADAAVHAVMVRAADALLASRAEPHSLAEQVRANLSAALASPHGYAVGVAKALGVSRRTLTRRLQQEGVSLSELLEQVRTEYALYYLERSNLPPNEIAKLLGYSSTATFCRAFARWQGTTPMRHRRARRGPTALAAERRQN